MTSPTPPHPTIGRHEFVAFVAAIMAVNALGVDLMLAALPAMARDLHVANPNHRQWVVTTYLFGFGLGQLVYGPLADRLGRRRVLLWSLAGVVGAGVFAASSATFPALLAARVLQGLFSASTRVLSVAIVRDSYSGRQMARISSLAQMVFFLVPILAPTGGQALLAIGPWRFIFYALAAYAAAVGVWAALRLPETLPPERRRPISLATLGEAYGTILRNRFTMGYAVAGALTFGAIIAFVSSAQQVFADTFHAGQRFTLLFGVCAAAMGFAAWLNSRLVERLGTRLISQTAVLGLIALSVLHLAIARAGLETLTGYVAIQALSMTCIGLCGSNFGAMAMEPVGHVAGTASSVQGFVSSIGAVAVGSAIGQAYDGTTTPFALGYLGVGLGVLAIVLWVEGGRLFRPRMAPAGG